MSLFDDIDELRNVVETELSTVDLLGVVSREERELVRRVGAHSGSITETHPGRTKSIYLTRPISSVASVSEYFYLGDTAPLTLTPNIHYVLWESQGRIERLGCHFGPKVVVAFTPEDDTELRKQVLIELVRIALSQSPYKSETVEGFEDKYSYVAAQDWQQAREQQYARLLMGPL